MQTDATLNRCTQIKTNPPILRQNQQQQQQPQPTNRNNRDFSTESNEKQTYYTHTHTISHAHTFRPNANEFIAHINPLYIARDLMWFCVKARCQKRVSYFITHSQTLKQTHQTKKKSTNKTTTWTI